MCVYRSTSTSPQLGAGEQWGSCKRCMVQADPHLVDVRVHVCSLTYSCPFHSHSQLQCVQLLTLWFCER